MAVNPEVTIVSCALQEGYTDNDMDCNDLEVLINPEGAETCESGADEDCDGSNNDINALFCRVFYQDSDALQNCIYDDRLVLIAQNFRFVKNWTG